MKSKKNSLSEKEINYGKCHYHLCNKKRVSIFQCKYCEEWFCEEHKSPKPPFGMHIDPKSTIERLQANESRREDAHPCFPYLSFWEKNAEVEDKKYKNALSEMLDKHQEKEEEHLRIQYRPKKQKSKKFEESHEFERDNEVELNKTKQVDYSANNFLHKNKSKLMILLWVVIHTLSLILIGFLLSKLNLNYNIGYLFLTGFGVTIISRIIRTFTVKEEFELDSYFLVYGILNTVTIWIVWFLLDKYSVGGGYVIRMIITAIALILVSKIIKYSRYVRNHKAGISFILLVIFLYANFGDLNINISKISSNIYSETKNNIQDIVSTDPISNKTKNVEQQVLIYTNIEREKAGLSPLSLDKKLSEIARQHSLDMVTRNFFDHVNPDGEDPTARAMRQGYNVHKELGGGWYSDGIGENIGKMPTGNVEGMGYVSSTPEGIAKAQVQSWMESPGHKANILDDSYTRLGAGVAYDGLYYVMTQDFY